MKYVSAREYAQMNNISVRWVQELCKNGKVPGATRITPNGAWLIPDDTLPEKSSKKLEEGFTMVNAEKQMETAQMLIDKFDFDMASVYFELAGEEFVRRGDYENALLAYNKMLYCFENEEKPLASIEDIKKIIKSIKEKVEG